MISEGDPSRRASDASALMRTALGPRSSLDLSDLLGYITRAMGVHGCVLWEMAPDPTPELDPVKGRLFVLASHFRAPIHCAKHDLAVAHSITGRVILGEPFVIENGVRGREHEPGDYSFLAGCSAMLTVALRLEDGSQGALNLYQIDETPFTPDDVLRLQEMAQLIPTLYRAAHDRVGFELSKAVDKTLRDAEAAAAGHPLGLDEKKTVLLDVCRTVAATFRCHEVSLFLYDCKEISLYLRDQSVEPVSYKLTASTIEPMLPKKSYEAGESNGLTGWVLQNRKPVWIFDLAQYDRDRDWINRLYPNLSWSGQDNIGRVARDVFHLPPGEPLPPLCVVAHPIQIGKKVIGVIRCALGKGPYYFSRRDQDLLALVAAEIGQCWGTWLSRREMKTENQSWTNLIESIKEINDLVQDELEEDRPDEDRIYREFLDRIYKVIPQSDLTSVRLLDPITLELYYKVIRGTAWDEKEWDRVKLHRSPVRVGKTESAAVQVIKDNLPYLLIPDTSRSRFLQKMFPRIRRKIVVPIEDAKKTFGVLDIRSTGDELFPKHALVVAQLLGRQLGLYRRLVDTIGRLKKEQRQQLQTWADISHQLKGPIDQAKRRSDLITDRVERLENEGLYKACRAVRGLCRKSQRVVASLELIAKLAREEPIQPNPLSLDYNTLIKILIAASQDAELMIDPRRDIKFVVDRESFLELTKRPISVDHGLLDQAINNIFDNAGKYSFKKSDVLISGIFAPEGFTISVRSRGLSIQPHEIARCIEREWRGEKAKVSTQEGSGIGLWIVDHIQKAHRGRLIIEPTTADYYTDVKLFFPFFRESRTP